MQGVIVCFPQKKKEGDRACSRSSGEESFLLFVSAHEHQFPYLPGQSWSQVISGVQVLVPGHLLRASVPNYIVLDTQKRIASWHTSSETWIPEDGLFDHLVLKLPKV
jgi:hypothetical protein